MRISIHEKGYSVHNVEDFDGNKDLTHHHGIVKGIWVSCGRIFIHKQEFLKLGIPVEYAAKKRVCDTEHFFYDCIGLIERKQYLEFAQMGSY